MKMILCLLFTLSAYAQTAQECLEESVETAIAVRVTKTADGDCSNINLEGFKNIEEDRNNKKRFLKNAIQALNEGKTIPSHLFMSLDESEQSQELNKDNLCGFLKRRNDKVIKEEVLKECPEATELFHFISAQHKHSDEPLYEVCSKLEQKKKQACKENKIVYEAMSKDGPERKPASVPGINAGGGSSAKAAAQ